MLTPAPFCFSGFVWGPFSRPPTRPQTCRLPSHCMLETILQLPNVYPDIPRDFPFCPSTIFPHPPIPTLETFCSLFPPDPQGSKRLLIIRFVYRVVLGLALFSFRVFSYKLLRVVPRSGQQGRACRNFASKPPLPPSCPRPSPSSCGSEKRVFSKFPVLLQPFLLR